LVLLVLALNYARVYTWVRRPGGCEADEVEIMTEYPLAWRAKLGPDRSIRSIAGHSTIAADPRRHAREVVLAAIEFHNKLASAAKPPQREISWHERTDDAP
jgi:hypothetical protein